MCLYNLITGVTSCLLTYSICYKQGWAQPTSKGEAQTPVGREHQGARDEELKVGSVPQPTKN